MNVTTVEELIKASHDMAVAKGWWHDGVPGTRTVVDQVNNFHAEISEAWEEYRHGRMEAWYSLNGEIVDDSEIEGNDRFMRRDGVLLAGTRWQGTCIKYGNIGWSEFVPVKPEGYFVELADLTIRIADTMGAYGWTFSNAPVQSKPTIPVFIAYLHDRLMSLTLDDYSSWNSIARHACERAVRSCFIHAQEHNINLFAVINEKMAYNATRSFRHGNLNA